MKIKIFFQLFTWHSIAIAINIVVFVLLFQTPIFSSMPVFFYRGCLLIMVGGIITGAMLSVFRTKIPNLLLRDLFFSSILAMSINLVFFTHLPVTADRSVTVFLLGYMADNPKRIVTEKEMEDFFIKRYVRDYRAMTRRFEEQQISGNIEQVGNGYKITQRGIKLMNLYENMAEIFGIEDQFIHPEK